MGEASRYTVEVTRERIKWALPCDPENCAVALALVECIAEVWDVIVDETQADLFIGDRIITIELPPKVCDFLAAFDAGGRVRPIRFEVEIPVEDEAEVAEAVSLASLVPA